LEVNEMKYYVYVSDSKVDMLMSQIPHDTRKKISTELKVDLKVLGASRKAETEAEDNRFTRLHAVVSFIREYGNVGTVDEPDEYIADTLALRWGPYVDGLEKDKTSVVYFGGSTSQTIVGLGGSSKHVIGNEGQSYATSASVTPILMFYLDRQLGLGLTEQESSESTQAAFERLHLRRVLTQSEREDWSLRAVETASQYMTGPEQRLEFLAKRLLYGEVYATSKKVLLATPLYVAMAE
jgi:hypothetical protein